jgi:ABC-type taurine transport system ATPase subunit
MSPRPGRVVEELEPDLGRDRPRSEVVTDPGFARLKESALEALSP